MSVDMSVASVFGDTPGPKFVCEWPLPGFVSRIRLLAQETLLSSDEKRVLPSLKQNLWVKFVVKMGKPKRRFLQLNNISVFLIIGLVSMSPITARLLTITAAARLLAVSPSTIRRLIDRQELSCTRISRSVRIPESSLLAFVDSHTDHTATASGSAS